MLAHEHLLIDIRCWHDDTHAATRDLRDVTVTARDGRPGPPEPVRVPRQPGARRRADGDEELARLQGLGSTLVIDVTPDSVGRDPARLAPIARASGLDIVDGLRAATSPRRVPTTIRRGPPSTTATRCSGSSRADGPRPAVIGEIGTSDPILPVEVAALAGAAQAQAEPCPGSRCTSTCIRSRGAGTRRSTSSSGPAATSSRTVLCHLDPQIPAGLDYHRSLLERGCTIAFDLWGDEDALRRRSHADRRRAHRGRCSS